MFLKILAHPVFVNLNFHMPMVVDLSHPLVMLTGENGAGKSTLLHSIYYAMKGEQIDGYIYRLDTGKLKLGKPYLFDAEQHNPRMQLELFQDNPQMVEFLQMASHGQVMLAMFRENFPSLPEGTILLLDEPEMAQQSAADPQDAARASRPEEIPHHLRHPLASADRVAAYLRDQPRQLHQQERSRPDDGHRRGQHAAVA